MKKKFILIILFLAALALTPLVGSAQSSGTTLETLHVSFWPEFDDPSVLILMDGRLPSTVTTPTQVTIPVPSGARVNAVARADETFGFADLAYEIVGQDVIFTIEPEETFRVEFYAPYTDDGQWRRFEFEWLAEIDVAELTAEVQQPETARQLITEPAAIRTRISTSDGLTYHTLPVQSVPSGTPYAANFRYNQVGEGTFIENNWAYLLAALALILVIIAVTWIVATRTTGQSKRRSKRPPKPKKARPVATSSPASTNFCHVCGQQVVGDDKFCRNCGAELKK